jgi:hypothetical protein
MRARSLSPAGGRAAEKYLGGHEAPAPVIVPPERQGAIAPLPAAAAAAPLRERVVESSRNTCPRAMASSAPQDMADLCHDVRQEGGELPERWATRRSAPSEACLLLEGAENGEAMPWVEDDSAASTSLCRMLNEILYAYGVDLTGGGSAGGGKSKTLGTELVLQQVAAAVSDGVLLCKLATCVERVTRTKTRCLPQSPMSSSIRGWTLNPKKRSQRVNNIRIALQALRNDRGIQVKGHASHRCLYHPDLFERGDVDTVHALLRIVHDSIAEAISSVSSSPQKAQHAQSWRQDRTRSESDDHSVEWAGGRGNTRDGEAAAARVCRRSLSNPRSQGEEELQEARRSRSQEHLQQRSASRSEALPSTASRTAQHGVVAVAATAAKDEADQCEENDTVIYDEPQGGRQLAARQGLRRTCADGCGGWEQVEALLEEHRAQASLNGHWTETLHTRAKSDLLLDQKGMQKLSLPPPSSQLQLHTCRWLVSLNLPEAPPALSRHEFANLSQAADATSFLEDPIKNGCMLLHVAQVLRGQQPCTPPWCKAQGRPTSVAAVRKNVEAALQLVQPLLHKDKDSEARGSVYDMFDVEALVSGDDNAVWSLLHQLRLSSKHRSSLSDPARVVQSFDAEARAASGKCGKQVLPYSREQVELLEVAIVMWLSAVAQHVTALKAILPSPGDGYPEVNLVGAAPRLLGLVVAGLHDSGGVLLANVASFATGMPVRAMRNVKSHGVAVANIRRICQQLADMNHVGRRFLPWIQNIVQGERQAVVLLLEDLMRCAYGLAPGRKLTASGNYARTAPGKQREVPFLDPLGNSRLANVMLQAADETPASLDVALNAARAADADLQRRRQFERHQVWRHSIASAVMDLPCAASISGSMQQLESEVATSSQAANGCFKHMEDLDAHLELARQPAGALRITRKATPGSSHKAPSVSSSRRPALGAARAFVQKASQSLVPVVLQVGIETRTAPCTRCAAWDGRQQRQTASPLLGARRKSGAGSTSPFKVANSPSKTSEPAVAHDSVKHVGRLRDWMRALKGGTVQWPHNLLECAPADFAGAWSDGVALCLLAGALQPMAGRTLLEGWEQHPRTRAHRAHNIRRALSVLGLQAKMHRQDVAVEVPLRRGGHTHTHTRPAGDESTRVASAAGAAAAAPCPPCRSLRGAEALMCDDALLDGDRDVIMALLRLVHLAYRKP